MQRMIVGEELNLYLLKPRGYEDVGGFDTAHGFVVMAKNAGQARRLASEEAGIEGASFWLSPDKSQITWLNNPKHVWHEGAHIILRDFHGG